jgi:hypothetical protein
MRLAMNRCRQHLKQRQPFVVLFSNLRHAEQIWQLALDSLASAAKSSRFGTGNSLAMVSVRKGRPMGEDRPSFSSDFDPRT